MACKSWATSHIPSVESRGLAIVGGAGDKEILSEGLCEVCYILHSESAPGILVAPHQKVYITPYIRSFVAETCATSSGSIYNIDCASPGDDV
jgi:hypothetical protein